MKKKLSRQQACKIFIRLSWKILEHKCRYYKGVGGKTIPDIEYDKLEDKYKKLAKLLGKEPYTTNVVGFPDSPSGRLVLEKLEAVR